MNPPEAASRNWLVQHVARLEHALDVRLPARDTFPARLHEAMRYGVEGGKRLRALIVYATGEALGTSAVRLDAPACAVELIHAYSLVHDDLPAMDNDALRRGRPTVHAAYGEANGILVGDALLTLAFEVLASDTTNDAAVRIAMVARLADAAGSRGMVGGQVVDIASAGKHLGLEDLQRLHAHKTGALILSALRMAACTDAVLGAEKAAALDAWGHHVGLAFQIQDDVLDVESSTDKLGKTQGKDVAQDKSTYVALLGLAEAKRRAAALFDEARNAIACFGADGAALRRLADHIQQRDH